MAGTAFVAVGPATAGSVARTAPPVIGRPPVGTFMDRSNVDPLGGFETDLDSRVFGNNGEIIRGLYAAGEAAGFGGGGVHGYRSLEGTFLGGCLFSGRNAGRAAAKAVA